MRKLLCLLLATLFLAACGGPSTESPEDMGKALVEILRADDVDGYLNVIMITDKDFDNLLEAVPAKVKEEIRRGRADQEKIKSDGVEDYYKTRKKGAAAGVDWAKIEYVGAAYNAELHEGVASSDIYVRIRFEGQEYNVRIDDCLKCGGRWFSVDGLRWEGPAE